MQWRVQEVVTMACEAASSLVVPCRFEGLTRRPMRVRGPRYFGRAEGRSAANQTAILSGTSQVPTHRIPEPSSDAAACTARFGVVGIKQGIRRAGRRQGHSDSPGLESITGTADSSSCGLPTKRGKKAAEPRGARGLPKCGEGLEKKRMRRHGIGTRGHKPHDTAMEKGLRGR